MHICVHSKSNQLDGVAVSVSFAAALLMSLEAIHPVACPFFALDDNQYFTLCALFATVTVFLGTFILTNMIVKKGAVVR